MPIDPYRVEPVVARQAYFMALRKFWPELLKSLRVDVFPQYSPRWHGETPQRRILRESWNELQSDSRRTELLAAIRDWANRFRIKEPWIIQTALDTLQNYSEFSPTPEIRPQRPGWFWLYMPVAEDPRFLPRLDNNVWYPDLQWRVKAYSYEDWSTFKTRMLSQFNKQLVQYRLAIDIKYAVKKKDKLRRDAEWTVLYQKGQPALEIAKPMHDATTLDPEQTVYRAIERFAKLIDLKLIRKQNRSRAVQKTRFD
jgi:hypothetical protein